MNPRLARHTTALTAHLQAIGLPRQNSALRWIVLVRELTGMRLQQWSHGRCLGYWWWLLEPIALSITYLLVMRLAFRAPTRSPVLFLMCAVLPWSWFMAGTSRCLHSLRSNRGSLQSFSVPYWPFPTSEVIATLIRFLFALPILFFLAIYYHCPIGSNLLWLIPLLAIQGGLTLGVGIWLAFLQSLFEDAQHMWQISARLIFFLSPSLYAVDQLPQRCHVWWMLNPFTAIFSGYRELFINGGVPSGWSLLVATLTVLLVLGSGIAVMHRAEGRLVAWL